ncbi:MAG: autophagy protein 6 [Bogoriella megaspora]|nr:MAG: autophagy protein 6 [Bogoriella megaspora]
MYCQKCKTPLKLDSSLDHLSPAAFKILAESGTPVEQHQSESNKTARGSSSSRPLYPQERHENYLRASAVRGTSVSARNTAPATTPGIDDPTMSFLMLSDSQIGPPIHNQKAREDRSKNDSSERRDEKSDVGLGSGTFLSKKAEANARLFDVLSSRSDIDHPVCVECAELLVEGLEKRLASATRERDAYVQYVKQVTSSIPTDEELNEARKELEKTRKREEEAFKELQRLEKEKAELDTELERLNIEAVELDSEEASFWKDRNAFSTTLTQFQNDRDALNAQYEHDAKQLERLQRTNVYNDTFSIGHDGYYGTINGLRLGRLSNPLIEWAEINAAWGQTCLLLATVAEKLKFGFQGYTLNPIGSTSTINKIEYPQSTSTNDPTHPAKPKITTLELYCNGDVPLGLAFLHRRFDGAMVAFLDCLRQLGDHVEQTGLGVAGLKMPYAIKKDKIGDASIKFGFNQEEVWTKACKYTLTCCKYLLAQASNENGAKQQSGP